jgi:hypothetical protein
MEIFQRRAALSPWKHKLSSTFSTTFQFHPLFHYAWLNLREWWWRPYIPPKPRWTSTRIHGFTLKTLFGRCSVRISVPFAVFLRSSRPVTLFSNPFQFIEHWSSHHSTLYDLGYWQRRSRTWHKASHPRRQYSSKQRPLELEILAKSPRDKCFRFRLSQCISVPQNCDTHYRLNSRRHWVIQTINHSYTQLSRLRVVAGEGDAHVSQLWF